MSNRAVAALRHAYRQVSLGLWQWCSSRGALLILLSLLALALALSYAFPQAPTYIRSDAIGYKEWLAEAQVRYKDWIPFLQAAGVFWVRDTVWFRLLLAVLSFNLLIALADRIGQMIWPYRAGQMVAAGRKANVVTMSSVSPAELAAVCVQEALQGLGLRVRIQAHGDQTRFYAHRARWAAAGMLGTYVGLIVIVAGMAVNHRWGWQQFDLRLLPNKPTLVSPQIQHRLELVSNEPGGALIKVEGGPEMTIRRERATAHRAFYYRLSGQGGEWLEVTARDQDDEPLDLSYYMVRPQQTNVLGFAFTGEKEPEWLFIVPRKKQVVRIQWQPGPEPRLQQWVFDQSGQLVGQAQVENLQNEAITQVEGIEYRWTAAPYVTVDVAYQPGNRALGVGAALAAAGLTMQLIPHQQLWGTVIPQNGGALVVMREQNSIWTRQRWSQVLASHITGERVP